MEQKAPSPKAEAYTGGSPLRDEAFCEQPQTPSAGMSAPVNRHDGVSQPVRVVEHELSFDRGERSGSPRLAKDLSVPEVTLIMPIGARPQLLTQTVWCLAQESPATIPQSIIAVTAADAGAAVVRELLTPSSEFGGRSVWQTLHAALERRGHSTHEQLALEVRTITGRRHGLAMSKLRDQTHDAADFIFELLRGRTSSDRARVVANVSADHAALGALTCTIFGLVARSSDRLTHVMVNAPYDQALRPGFYFPEQPAQVLQLPDGSEVRAADARIELVDIPFVVLRNAVPGLADHEPTFTRLVARYNERFTRQGHRTGIVVDFTRETIQVEGVTRRFHKHELIVLEFWLRLYEAGITPQDHAEAAELFRGYHGLPADEAVAEPHNLARVRALPSSKVPAPPSAWLKRVSKDYVRKPLSTLRVWMRKTVHIELPPLGSVLENFELRIKS